MERAPKAKAKPKAAPRSSSAVRARPGSPAAVMAATAARPEYSAVSAVADKEVELVIDRKAEDVRRCEILTALADMENFDPGQDPRAFHGRAFSALLGEAELPKTV